MAKKTKEKINFFTRWWKHNGMSLLTRHSARWRYSILIGRSQCHGDSKNAPQSDVTSNAPEARWRWRREPRQKTGGAADCRMWLRRTAQECLLSPCRLFLLLYFSSQAPLQSCSPASGHVRGEWVDQMFFVDSDVGVVQLFSFLAPMLVLFSFYLMFPLTKSLLLNVPGVLRAAHPSK